jgi:hypothetical protein
VKLGNWIYDARRTSVRDRLVDDERVTPARAERFLAAWEAEADRGGENRDSPDYWRDGARWIFAQLPPRSGHSAP